MAAGDSGAHPRGGEPFFAWPGMASFRLTLPLSYLFFKIFYSVYGGASLLAKLRRPLTDFYFSWEMRLPFLPSWSLIYLSVPLLLLATPFILRTWRGFTPFVLTLTAETLIAGVFFLAIPLAQAYPPRIADGFFGGVFHLADRLNLDYNKFPSLHIAFAVTLAAVFGRRCGWFGRTLFSLWLAAVLASTMLIHEHQLLDLLGGLALGLFGVVFVQRRVTDERYLDALRIDGLCLGPLATSIRRHVRSLRPIWAITRASLPRWGQTRPLRVSYSLAQHVADVLEGDRRAPAEPEPQVQAILTVLRDGSPAGAASGEQLAAYLAAELGMPARGELIALLETLIEDGSRLDGRHPAATPALAERVKRIFPPPPPVSSAGTAPAPPRSAASR
jgi:hypothetical protein